MIAAQKAGFISQTLLDVGAAHGAAKTGTAVEAGKDPTPEMKRPPGSRSGLKYPLGLLEGPIYNSFSRWR